MLTVGMMMRMVVFRIVIRFAKLRLYCNLLLLGVVAFFDDFAIFNTLPQVMVMIAKLTSTVRSFLQLNTCRVQTEHICLQRQTRNSICMKEQLNQCALWKYRTNTAVSIDILYNVLPYTFIIPNDCWVHSFVLLLYILLRERLKLQKPRIQCEQIEPRGGSMLLYVGQDAFEIPSFFFFCW